MEYVDELFGTGTHLTVFQMSSRAFVVFILALIFLRISGRRSFGMRSPLDNTIVILLGAILGRAIVGASPFLPVMACSLLIVLLHRLLGWAMTKSILLADFIQGKHIPLYENGAPIKGNMERALVCERDLELAIRNKAQTEDFGQITKLFMEPNGEISVIKK